METITKKNNPYIAARYEWAERYGSFVKEKKIWRIAALLSLLCNIMLISSYVYLSLQSRFVPFIVEIDKIGRPVETKILQGVSSTYDTRVARALLSHFIVNLRTTFRDADAQNQSLKRAYFHVSESDPAFQYLHDYFSQDKNNPYLKAREKTINIDIRSILQQSEYTWIIEWDEHKRNVKSGLDPEQLKYKAVVTIRIQSPESEEVIINNPIGLYVKEVYFSKVLGGKNER